MIFAPDFQMTQETKHKHVDMYQSHSARERLSNHGMWQNVSSLLFFVVVVVVLFFLV